MVFHVAGGQAFWLVGTLAVVGKCGQDEGVTDFCVNRMAQRSITGRFDGCEQQEHGLVGRGVTEEFCVKVLKFEIMNSRNLFHYFSRVVPRTIDTVHPVMLSLSGLKY